MSYYSSASGYGGVRSTSTSHLAYENRSRAADVADEFNASAATSSSFSNISTASASQDIQVNVELPESAKVFVNGNPTTSTGTSRRFVSRNLEAGSSYRFEIRAEQQVDGRTVTRQKTLVLMPGAVESLAFNFDEPKLEKTETVLKLNVPAEAKVVLAGNQTKTTGEARTYRTQELAAGQVWNDYVISVSWNGQVKEKAIRLIGGDELEVSISFDAESSVNEASPTLASR
jgi:uncharacterized protein (TIGR03000 family)